MHLHDHAEFQVAVKTILRKDDKILALSTPDGYVDFPGGRMDNSEIDMNILEVLRREVEEELGELIRFEVNKIAFVAKRQYDFSGKTHRIMAIYYDTYLTSGNVRLSDEHVKFEWVDPASLFSRSDKFISADEFEQFKKYFS